MTCYVFSGTLNSKSLTHLTPKGPNQLQSHRPVGAHSVTGVPVAPTAKTTDVPPVTGGTDVICSSRMSAPHLSIDAGEQSPLKNWHRALLNTIDQHKTNRPIFPFANETRDGAAPFRWVFCSLQVLKPKLSTRFFTSVAFISQSSQGVELEEGPRLPCVCTKLVEFVPLSAMQTKDNYRKVESGNNLKIKSKYNGPGGRVQMATQR